MTCADFLSLLPQYPDQMPDDDTTAVFLAHAAECAECANLLVEQEAMLLALSTMDDDLEVPETFSSGWRKAVQEEALARPSKRGFASWKYAVTAAAALVVVLGGTALMRAGLILPDYANPKDQVSTAVSLEYDVAPSAASPATMMAYEMTGTASMKRSVDATVEGASYDVETEVEDAGSGNGAILLHSATINLSSERYDEVMASISSLLEANDGWVSYRSEYGESLEVNPEAGRYAYWETRVPVQALPQFVAAVSDLGHLTGSEMVTEDVSASYYDVQGRLDMYIAQRNRLNELMEKAEAVSDIIEIESKLGEVQYSIDSLSGRIQNWDSRAKDATVTISVTETAHAKEFARQPLRQRLKAGLANAVYALQAFAQDVLVFLVMALPYVVFIAAIGGIVYLVIYLVRKRKMRRTKK